MAEQERRGFGRNEIPRRRDERGEADRVHSVGQPQKPAGGPFGPGKKKKPWEKAGPLGSKPQTGGGTGGGGEGNDRRTFRDSRGNFAAKPPRSFGNAAGPGQAGKPKWGSGKVATHKVTAKATGRTDWSDVAEWYDDLVGDEGSEFHREVVLPGTKKLLGEVSGKRVLDVACGQGVLSRQLQELGASVTGVDAAAELLDAARERGPGEIVYRLGDAQELAGIEEGAYDAAACLLAIQNIQSPQAVFSAVARCLKPGGVFVVVMMHPAFRSPKATQWGWVPAPAAGEAGNPVQFRRVDRYLLPRKEPIVTHPGKNDGEYTWTFHRPISDYVNFARKGGLLTDAMEEWASHKHSDSGPRAAAENAARKEIPMFLAIRFVKNGSTTDEPR